MRPGPPDSPQAAFEHLLDQAPVMIWASGPDGGCTYFNRAWLAYTGRDIAAELGEGWAEGVHPEDLARCVATYRDHFSRRAPFRMEYRLRRADGTYGWILDDGAPRYATDGEFVGFIGSCVDVSDTRSAMRSQTMARAVIRRVLLELIQRAKVPEKVVRDMGRALATEAHPQGGIEGYVEEFREMGFGNLRAEEWGGARATFVATDLLERRREAPLPTCFLTLGYLEGAVSAARGKPALGSEMRCQSLGHDACRFVVMTQ